MSRIQRLLLGIFPALTALMVAAGADQSRDTAPTTSPTDTIVTFTTAQANGGRAVYLQQCASCHGDVGGTSASPPLSGPEFHQNWFGQPVQRLFDYTRSRMPPSASPKPSDQQYADIVAYLLTRNGLLAGERALTPEPASLAASLPWQLPQGGGEAVAGTALPPASRSPNPLDSITPVTEDMLAAPPSGEWLTWRRTRDLQGFSPLTQINRANVASLRPVWSWSLPPGPNEGTPLFHDGVLFVQSWADKVQALDATTGDLLWQYSPRATPNSGLLVKRAIALYGDKVYAGTSLGHIVALSMKDGRVAWDRALTPVLRVGLPQLAVTGGPIVARGKVLVGTVGSAPGGNLIVALDAASGEEVWRVTTIAQPGASGGDSWNGLSGEKRTGASVYVPGSYDASLNLVFFGTAQTYDTLPLREPSADRTVTREALHTDSTLAIDPDTGRLVWHFQHLANDQWDLDWSLEQVLLKLPGQTRTLLATAGKQAIYDILDAGTGRYESSIDLGLQDVVTRIDSSTGVKEIDPSKMPVAGQTTTVCPHSVGAKSWLPESLNGSRLFVPLNESCMDLVPVPAGGRAMLTTGVRWMLRPRRDSDGNYGRLDAIDLETHAVVWTSRQRSPVTTGVLATAGGVVFAGGMDRRFTAFDDASGKPLWNMRLNDVPNGAPMTFLIHGRQFIALTTGNGGALATTFPMLLPELRNPTEGGATLWIFALPDR